MRSKSFFLAFVFATAAHAQQPVPQAPATPVAPAPGQPKPEAPAAAPAAAPGIVTLSEVAKQASAEAKAVPSQAALAEVPAIAPIEGSAALEATRARLRAAAERQAEPAKSIMLSRISNVGGDMGAILWVQGQHRKVASGMHVLQYTVGQIRDDGVCLFTARAGGHVKDQCPTLLTYSQGVL